MNSIKRTQIADGAFFNSIKDNRFKTMKITANLVVPLSEQTASANALLLGVLSRSCKKYPDFKTLSKKLASLYGADLITSVRKVGERQVLSISVAGIDDRYALNGDSVATDLSNLLCDVVFEPNIDNNAFSDTDVEQERRQLLDLIDSELNEKRTYANAQLIKNMCQNEVFGVKRYGNAEQIKSVTASSLYTTWQNLLKTAWIEILYIGDSSSENALEVFRTKFSEYDRTPLKATTNVVRKAGEIRRFSEEMELSQSKLVMGFRTDCATPDSDVTATRLMCAILGGTASSKLFCNVREKQSLCYYCSSIYDRQKGIMVVDSGVEGENLEKAEQGILKEIDDMKNGKISDFEIDSAKKAVINSFNTSNDTVSGIETWYSAQLFDDEFKDITTMSNEINAVTKEQIIKSAQKLSLDSIFVLKNK